VFIFPSRSGQSASERSVTAASDLSSQRPVRSDVPTATGTPNPRSRAPSSTGGDSVAPAWQWTNIRDRRLQALAALHNHHFTRAAAVLSHEFGDVVSEAVCRQRYGNIMRGTNSVAAGDIQERDEQFYYRRMHELNASGATVSNVNQRLMEAIQTEEPGSQGVQDVRTCRSASDLSDKDEEVKPAEPEDDEKEFKTPGYPILFQNFGCIV
jgi:hypothetical protein